MTNGPRTLAALCIATCIFSLEATAENLNLPDTYIDRVRAECAQYVELGEFKGEPTAGYSTSRGGYFELKDDAIETYTIGSETSGMDLYIISKHKMLCAGTTMNDECGSSGCAYTIFAGGIEYVSHGAEPKVISAYGQNILLIATHNQHCGASSIGTLCVEAWTWDPDASKLVSISAASREIEAIYGR